MLVTTKQLTYRLDSIVELENNTYPSDFFMYPDDIEHWIDSNMFFCNSIVYEDHVSSVVSFLITSHYDIKLLLDSKIKESELTPYNHHGYPVLYFASLILEHFQHGPILFKNIFSEILEQKIILEVCYSIAANNFGLSFLQKLGFDLCGKYKKKYPIMVSSEYTVLQSFFKKVLLHNKRVQLTAIPLRPSGLLHSGN